MNLSIFMVTKNEKSSKDSSLPKRKNHIILPAIIILLILIILSFVFLPLKEFISFNYNHRLWSDKSYTQVKAFNHINYGSTESNDFKYTQIGKDVPQNPQLFSKKLIKYLPKTKRWIIGVYGVKDSAAHIGMIDKNRYDNFYGKNGDFYPNNYIITDNNMNPINETMLADFVLMEVNESVFNNNILNFRIYRPDMSVYDEVKISID